MQINHKEKAAEDLNQEIANLNQSIELCVQIEGQYNHLVVELQEAKFKSDEAVELLKNEIKLLQKDSEQKAQNISNYKKRLHDLKKRFEQNESK